MLLPAPRTLHLAAAALAVVAATAAEARPTWSTPTLIDTRTVLELGQLRQDPTDGSLFVPVLFDLAPNNSLEIAVVDTASFPPGYVTRLVTTANAFALGAAAQVGSRIGFSFIDPAFDGRFGTCPLPCASASNLPVATGTYIDSASAGSADDYFVALLDNAANHAILTRYSTNNGTTWQNLHNTLPPEPGGVYDNFHGGKRIQLLVDTTATDPAQTRNCLFYEVRPSPGTTTALRLNCRIGTSAAATEGGGVFNIAFDTDVPNGANQFDRLIESNCVLVVNGGGGNDVLCAYSHRQSQQMRVVRVNESGQIVQGPTSVGAVPGGTDFYGLTVSAADGNDEIRVLRPDESGSGTKDVTVHPIAGSSAAPLPGWDFPVSASGPEVELFSDPIVAFLWGFFGGAFTVGFGDASDEPLGATTGLFASRQLLPLFADGFDTGNRLRWSSSSPP